MYFIGVDGGGTKTAAILTDLKGDIMRRTRTGSGNITMLDRGSVAQLINGLITDLLKEDAPQSVGYATLGFAGGSGERPRKTVSNLLHRNGIQAFSILTDAMNMYLAAFDNKQGILLAAGTGSTCLTKDDAGNFIKIGGCGYLLSDEGSGYDIGNMAIRKFIQAAAAGKKRSPLASEVLHFYGMSDENELISEIYASLRPHWLIASCAETICEAAVNGDPDALDCIDRAAKALFEMVDIAQKRIGGSDGVRLSLAGSILGRATIVRQKFDEQLSTVHWLKELVEQKYKPEVAALFHAIRTAGYEVSEELHQRLKIKFSDYRLKVQKV